MRDFALPGNFWLAAVVYALGLIAIWRHGGTAKGALPMALGLHLLFLLRAGGDWMADGRFFVVMLPLCAIVWGAAFFQFVEAAIWAANRQPGIRLAVYAASFLLSAQALVLLGDDSQLRTGRLRLQPGIGNFSHVLRPHGPLEEWKVGNADGRIAVGRWVAAHARPGQTVLASEMGLDTVINPQIRFLDMRGLTDRKIARMRGLPRDLAGVQGEREWMNTSRPLGRYLHSRRPEWVALLWTVYHPDSNGVTQANDLYAPFDTFLIHCDGRDLLVATWKRRDIPTPL